MTLGLVIYTASIRLGTCAAVYFYGPVELPALHANDVFFYLFSKQNIAKGLKDLNKLNFLYIYFIIRKIHKHFLA